eukprot:TRINITY_DN10288_c0_g2_i3.p1 TRINITY_DN10288_c0_g2~~TRINITY_DN10288_c0_g2_i3.p1  ORF type:complete len:167 (+),score=25.01 TRINITY_DN10288_c0_g2_i3:73-573(+)
MRRQSACEKRCGDAFIRFFFLLPLSVLCIMILMVSIVLWVLAWWWFNYRLNVLLWVSGSICLLPVWVFLHLVYRETFYYDIYANLKDHQLEIQESLTDQRRIPAYIRLSVCDFHLETVSIRKSVDELHDQFFHGLNALRSIELCWNKKLYFLPPKLFRGLIALRIL